MKKFSVKALIALMFAAGAASAMAGSVSSTLSNSVTISNNCTISAQGFTNTYDPIVTNFGTDLVDSSAHVQYTCTNSSSGATIALDQGQNAAAGSTAAAPLRQLKSSGGSALNYNLYSDSGYSTVWGSGVSAVSATQDGAQHSVSVYAKVPKGQNVPVGTYTDVVAATINF